MAQWRKIILHDRYNELMKGRALLSFSDARGAVLGESTPGRSPVESFLSHASADIDLGLIDPLEREQQLRGMSVWRDRSHLLAGQHNWDEIEAAVNRATVFVVVITPRSIGRPNVWREIRYADQRWRREPTFPIIAVRIGVTRQELDEACRMPGIHKLSAHQQVEVSLDPSWSPAEDPGWAARVAEVIVQSAVQQRVREAPDRPLQLALRTYPKPTPFIPDLDLDWSSFFTPEPSTEDWQRLITALSDTAAAVTKQSRQPRIEVSLLARLGASLGLGWAIPVTSGRELDVVHSDGRATWPSDAEPVDDGATIFREEAVEGGAASIGAIVLSLKRDARAMYERSTDLPRAGRLLFVERESDLDAGAAAHAARELGIRIRRWCDQHNVNEIHVVGVAPVGFGVLLGRQLNATADVAVFHDQGNVYVAACRLPVGGKGVSVLVAGTEGEASSRVQRVLRWITGARAGR